MSSELEMKLGEERAIDVELLVGFVAKEDHWSLRRLRGLG